MTREDRLIQALRDLVTTVEAAQMFSGNPNLCRGDFDEAVALLEEIDASPETLIFGPKPGS